MKKTIYFDNEAEMEVLVEKTSITLSVKRNDMEFPIDISLDIKDIRSLQEDLYKGLKAIHLNIVENMG